MNILVLLSLIMPVVAKELPVNTADSTLKWVGTKVTGQHNGSVKLKSGSINIEKGKITRGQFEIDMQSITVEDLQGGMADKLTGHLKSDDFFSVDKYPTATFKLKKVTMKKKPEPNGDNAVVTGDLTIRGKTAPLTFPAQVKVESNKASAAALVKVDRTKYDVKYGSGKFFKGLGDKMIHDEFTLALDLKANAEEQKAR